MVHTYCLNGEKNNCSACKSSSVLLCQDKIYTNIEKWIFVASGSSGLLTQAVGALPTASSCRDGNLDIAGGMAAEPEVMSGNNRVLNRDTFIHISQYELPQC